MTTDQPYRERDGFTLKSVRSFVDRSDVLYYSLIVFCCLFFVAGTQEHRNYLYFFVLVPFVLTLTSRSLFVIRDDRLFQLSAAFLVYLCLTQLWSPKLSVGELLEDLLKAACILLFVLLVARLREERPRLVVLLFECMGIAGAVTAVIAMAGAEDLGPPQRLIGFGRADHPIIGAALYAIAAVGLIGVLTWQRPSRREIVLYGLALVPLFAFVILSGSRGVLVGLIAALAIWTLFLRNYYILFVGAAVVAAVGVAVWLDISGFGSFLDRGASYRFEVWGQTMDRIAENLWFGASYVTHKEFVMTDGSVVQFSHNIILSNQLYGGLVATILLLAMIVVMARRAVQAIRQDGEFAIGLIFLLGMVCGLFDFTITPKGAAVEYLYFWLPIGLAIGRRRALSSDLAADGGTPASHGR